VTAVEAGCTVAVAGFVAGAAAWWLAGDINAKQWWLVPLVVVPPMLATAWAAKRLETHIGYATGGLALIVCLFCAALGWSARSPEPPIFAALRARESSATTTAEAMTSPDARGSCSPATTVELGVLGELGPWETVCVSGSAAPEHSISLHRPAGSTEPGLSYSSWPDDPDSCIRRIDGNWWAVTRPVVGDASAGCPRGFSFQGA
jgi:hypothetical protein